MYKMKTAVAAMALALAVPHLAFAQSTADMSQIREQIRQIKEEYEARIKALERRLSEAEAKAGKAEQQASKAEAAVAAAPAARQAQNAFNPGISLILQGRYASLSKDPDSYRINGFIPSGGEVEPGERGFSLAESELDIYANIDPYFRCDRCGRILGVEPATPVPAAASLGVVLAPIVHRRSRGPPYPLV